MCSMTQYCRSVSEQSSTPVMLQSRRNSGFTSSKHQGTSSIGAQESNLSTRVLLICHPRTTKHRSLDFLSSSPYLDNTDCSSHTDFMPIINFKWLRNPSKAQASTHILTRTQKIFPTGNMNQFPVVWQQEYYKQRFLETIRDQYYQDCLCYVKFSLFVHSYRWKIQCYQ